VSNGAAPTFAQALQRSRTRQEGLFRRMAGVRLHQLERERLGAALVDAERAAKRGDAQARAEADARIDALLEQARRERT